MGKIPAGGAGRPGPLAVRLAHLRPGVPVIHCSGSLDGTTVAGLRRLLDEQLAAAPWAIVLDLSSVSVLEPDAVHALVDVASRAGQADIGLSLVTADSAVIRSLVTADVHDLFDIHPNMDVARRALRLSPPRPET
jgi:anti-anti-sigma factor